MKSFAIIGIGNFGRSVATTLCKLGHEVLAMDISEDRYATSRTTLPLRCR